MRRILTYTLTLFILCNLTAFGQNTRKNYWLSFTDKTKNKCGYINQAGDTIIKAGNYDFCFTDTFRTYAIVLDSNSQLVGIDRQQNILYTVFPFDNGPDYPSEGFFRITIFNKIGYADEATGKIIIKPQFDCVFPFENGVAKVGMNCKIYADDAEHHTWTTEKWLYINKKGKIIKPPSLKKG